MRLGQSTASATRSGDDFISASVDGALFVAFELGWADWKLAMASQRGAKPRRRTIAARDLAALAHELQRAKAKLNLPAEAPVYTCYEAGRDGFWLDRYLRTQGIGNVIVDSASIEVNRRRRRAKNDKLDAGKLLSMLMRYHDGEAHVWAVVRPPGVEDEDLRQRQRELEALRDERKDHVNRIKGLLATHGIDVKVDRTLRARLDRLTTPDGRSLPAHLRACVRRELDRMALLNQQIGEIEKERDEHQKQQNDAQAQQVRQLCALRGIGPECAWVTVSEVFGWRAIRNRKELAALAGLTPTPYDSGEMQHDQGISKAGNKRVRWMMVQIAWIWLRNQPHSALSQWYQRRFGSGNKRQKRIGIVALARKLLIKLWQYLETGVVPQGAALKVN